MILLFANNAVTTLANPITALSTTVQVAAGQGVLFPQPIVGQQFFKLTFVSASDSAINEIVNVTKVVGDVFTIVRAQEGTAALAWNAGDSATNMTTAQTQDNFIQVQQAQTGQTNTAKDTGTPNSYVAAITPAVTSRIFGLYVRIQALNANTGPSTLNLGAGSFPITNPDGTALGAGAIAGGGFFEVVDDGVLNYQLISASQEAQSSAGILTTGAFQWRPTAETIAGWIVGNTTTIGNAASNATQLANATAANLFEWHWNEFSNTVCPVFTSAGAPTARGANAPADFAANKTIATLDMRCLSISGVDGMGSTNTNKYTGVPIVSGNDTTPGSVIGENLHDLVHGEVPTITSNGSVAVSVSGVSTTSSVGVRNGVSANGNGIGINQYTDAQIGFTGSGSGTASVTSNNTGGTAPAHNNKDLTMLGTWYIKL